VAHHDAHRPLAALAEHTPEPFIDLHPQDALLCGVREGELARVTSRWGAMVARVQHGGGIARGSVFVPIHWSGQTASDARVGAVVNPAVDPVSGEPEFKHTPVRIEPFGVSLARLHPQPQRAGARQVAPLDPDPGRGFVRYELAGRGRSRRRTGRARCCRSMTRTPTGSTTRTERRRVPRRAPGRRPHRSLRVRVARQDLPARAWLAGLFGKETLDAADRAGAAGRPRARRAPIRGRRCAPASASGATRSAIAIREQTCKTRPR
jgi:assimilatory nitrate reductase catalytic subunit